MGAQDQIDSRALELAAELKGAVGQIGETLRAHLDDCLEERRQAGKQRHDFRAEMALGMAGLEAKMGASFNAVHGRISGTKNTLMGIGGTTIVLLLGLCGFLFAKVMGW